MVTATSFVFYDCCLGPSDRVSCSAQKREYCKHQ